MRGTGALWGSCPRLSQRVLINGVISQVGTVSSFAGNGLIS